jgi:hypothetical protein
VKQLLVRTESAKLARVVDKERRRSFKTESYYSPIEVDEREGRTTVRGPPSLRVRRDRIYPEDSRQNMFKQNGEGRKHRRRSSRGKHLKVETKNLESKDKGDDTPRTEASTPVTPPGVRGSSDLRSPGQRKSPTAKVASDDEAPVPDFITQTDQYGNAITPRSSTAIQKARVERPTAPKPHLHVGKDGKLTEEDETMDNVSACAETILDSLRIMCCCLLPEEDSVCQAITKKVEPEQRSPKENGDVERPRLLPKLHPDDHGKKCLVLDLDETLVHSSFRAVPGADFVIPVQVSKCATKYLGLGQQTELSQTLFSPLSYTD